MSTSSNKINFIFIIMLAVTVANLATTLYSQGRQYPDPDNKKTRGDKRLEEFKKHTPITDYEAPESSDLSKRAKRKARSEWHNKSLLGVKGGLTAPISSGNEIVLITDWEVNVPRLPAAQSDVVVVGEILDANAYLSTDKNGVYSEFSLRVSDILKNDDAFPISSAETITVERLGGRVRYPSGRVEWFRIALQNMPLVNRRYVLFLKRSGDDSFSIITGYELRNARVYPLDNEASQFRVYEDMDETSFLQLVREASTK